MPAHEDGERSSAVPPAPLGKRGEPGTMTQATPRFSARSRDGKIPKMESIGQTYFFPYSPPVAAASNEVLRSLSVASSVIFLASRSVT